MMSKNVIVLYDLFGGIGRRMVGANLMMKTRESMEVENSVNAKDAAMSDSQGENVRSDWISNIVDRLVNGTLC